MATVERADAVLGFRVHGWPNASPPDLEWPPGVNVARCGKGHRHKAPDPACTCGLYSHTAGPRIVGSGFYAAVRIWGAVFKKCGDELRAEFAEIVAVTLVVPPRMSDLAAIRDLAAKVLPRGERWIPGDESAARRVAAAYGVPFIAPGENPRATLDALVEAAQSR